MILLLLFGFQADFKLFDAEGKDLFKQGQYEQAATKFKEALRLNPKPQKYKAQGTFFEDYLPRYWLALCFEQVDVIEAEKWFQQSREALERDVLKRRNDIAAYNDSGERISKAAETERTRVAAAFQLELDKAKAFLNRDQFDQAQQAYEALLQKYPGKAEVQAGMENVRFARKTKMNQVFTELQLELARENVQEAEHVLARLRTIDSQNPKIAEAEDLIRQKRADMAQARNVKPVEREPDPEPVRKDPIPRKDPDPVVRNPESTSKKPDLAALKSELLASIETYRRGDPRLALERLQNINSTEKEGSRSFLWLRSLYQFELSIVEPANKDALQQNAASDIKSLLAQDPDFEPNPKLVSDQVITFFARVKGGI